MTLTYHDPSCEIHQGHVLDVLAEMPAESVDCCITSPPYWSLRKYSGDQNLIWGGKEDCQHEWGEEIRAKQAGGTNNPFADKKDWGLGQVPQGQFCSLCGAWRGALGLEPAPELYLVHLVEIFRAVRRVLRPWGTCWVNCGDSYAANRSYQVPDSKGQDVGNSMSSKVPNGLKPLDLCGIPESLVLALRADGWYWRSTIIWAKTNPMPESVAGWAWLRHKVKAAGRTEAENEKEGENNRGSSGLTRPTLQALWQDCPGCPTCAPNDGLVLRKGSWRPTSSWEYVFMLAKSKDYFCDGEAVKENSTTFERENNRQPHFFGGNKGRQLRTQGIRTQGAEYTPVQNRNLRDVWTINTQPYSGAHFATFPEELVKKPILASTSDKGNCPKCGMPFVRVIGKGGLREHPARQHRSVRNKADFDGEDYAVRDNTLGLVQEVETLSWRASCSCGITEAIPAIVLDPFCGSGTTGKVAKQLGRRVILIDISEEYCSLAKERIEAVSLPMRL